MGYRVVNGTIFPVAPIGNISHKIDLKGKSESSNFDNILSTEVNKNDSFIISSHAVDRLKNRNITLNNEDMKAINEGINKAGSKGCTDSVIFYKDTAYVTSIKNRTVITAVDKESCKQNIFTNIDSVVIL